MSWGFDKHGDERIGLGDTATTDHDKPWTVGGKIRSTTNHRNPQFLERLLKDVGVTDASARRKIRLLALWVAVAFLAIVALWTAPSTDELTHFNSSTGIGSILEFLVFWGCVVMVIMLLVKISKLFDKFAWGVIVVFLALWALTMFIKFML